MTIFDYLSYYHRFLCCACASRRTEGAAVGRKRRICRARQAARRYRNASIQCQVTCQPMILSAKITLFKQRINGNETKIFPIRPILNLSVCFPSHVGFLIRIGSGQAPFCKKQQTDPRYASWRCPSHFSAPPFL